jgi:hypothetical protein
MNDLEKLKVENDALKNRLAKLEEQVNPPPRQPSTYQPPDYTAGMSMPPEAIREMVRAIPESVMQGIREDARKQNPVTGGPNPQPQSQPVPRGSAWQEPRPAEPVPGIKYVDALVDQQDKIDRAELAMKLAKAEMLKK